MMRLRQPNEDDGDNYIVQSSSHVVTPFRPLVSRIAFRGIFCKFNSLTAIGGHDRQYFNKLHVRVVSQRIFVHS
jgi:hypothetical protein